MAMMLSGERAPGRMPTGIPTAWVSLFAVFATAAAWYAIVPSDSPARLLLGDALLLLVPPAAGVACLRAGRRAPRSVRTTWRLIAAACFTVSIGGVVAVLGPILVGSLDWHIPFVFFLLFHPLFIAGALAALGPRPSRESVIELGLDAALLLGCGAIIVLRFVWEPSVGTGAAPNETLSWLLAIQLFSIGSAFAAGLLVLWEDTEISSAALAALLGATLVFALANLLTSRGPGGAATGTSVDLVWLAGWILMLGAALAGVRTRPRQQERRSLSGLAERLSRVLVPATALLFAIMAIDAVNDPLRTESGIALAILGLLLACRSAQALGLVSRGRAETERHAHARALIEVSHSLAVATDLDLTLDTVGMWAARLLRAPSAGIELLGEDGAHLEVRSIANMPRHAIGLRFHLDDSFTGQAVRIGKAHATERAAQDPLVVDESIRYLGDAALAAAPIRYRERVLGVLFVCKREDPFVEDELELLQALADQAGIAIENARLFEQVRALSMTDPLTGLANRRQLEHDLARDFASAQRGRPLTLVLFDLDNFKQYNDAYGHLAGDEVLRTFGRVIAESHRATNLAARFGGDEFIVLLTDCDVAGADIFVQRVRKRFARTLAELRTSDVSVSAGIAQFSPALRSPASLILEADRALYDAKGQRAAS
ncbi:MAG: diguanylate cyclase domain-containing protein [Longimicrobiales bacterium]